MNKLTPLQAPFTAEVERLLSRYPKQDGYILSLFRTFANSVRFLEKGVPNLLDRRSPIDLRTREIVILRTTANRSCEYEWGVHVAVFSKAAKLTEAQVRATRATQPDCWTAAEARLIAVVDQLCRAATLDRDTLTSFRSDWRCEQQLEIMALVGTYSTISYVANVAELPPESFAARFPATTASG